MEKLYALAVKGKMFYYSGRISDSQLILVDRIANSIDITHNNLEIFKKIFSENVKSELGIELTCIDISYVFRKHSK